MSNNLFNLLGNSNNAMSMPMNDMIQRFNQFKSQFRGDPQQIIQTMLNTGQISQAQYDAAVKQANMLKNVLGM